MSRSPFDGQSPEILRQIQGIPVVTLVQQGDYPEPSEGLAEPETIQTQQLLENLAEAIVNSEDSEKKLQQIDDFISDFGDNTDSRRVISRETRKGHREFGLLNFFMMDPKSGDLLVVRKDTNVDMYDPTDWLVVRFNVLTGDEIEHKVQVVEKQTGDDGDTITMTLDRGKYGLRDWNELIFSVNWQYNPDGKGGVLKRPDNYHGSYFVDEIERADYNVSPVDFISALNEAAANKKSAASQRSIDDGGAVLRLLEAA